MNPRLLMTPKKTLIQHIKKSNPINYLDLVSLPSSKHQEKPISIPKPFLKNSEAIIIFY